MLYPPTICVPPSPYPDAEPPRACFGNDTELRNCRISSSRPGLLVFGGAPQKQIKINISKNQNLKVSKFNFSKCNVFMARLPFWSTNKKRKVATNIISYKRYKEILFQKVASGYLLRFVQDGSSKNVLEQYVLRKNVNNQKIEKMPYIGVRGSRERGYFVLGCVGSGRWADFESCSRIHACGFRCFCRKVA